MICSKFVPILLASSVFSFIESDKYLNRRSPSRIDLEVLDDKILLEYLHILNASGFNPAKCYCISEEPGIRKKCVSVF